MQSRCPDCGNLGRIEIDESGGGAVRATCDCRATAPKPEELADMPKEGYGRPGQYDPGFSEAIEQGYLTVRQAVERGDRVLLAATVRRKHDLTPAESFLVADNRILLADLLARKAGVVVPNAADPHAPKRAWILAGGTVVIAACTVVGVLLQPKPVQARHAFTNVATRVSHTAAAQPSGLQHESVPLPDSVVVTTDEKGHVVQVSASDPKSVLAGLCAHPEFAGSLSPIELVQSVPAGSGDRLGLIRDNQDRFTQRAVGIHLDPRTGRWFAGDGHGPIELQRAPEIAHLQ